MSPSSIAWADDRDDRVLEMAAELVRRQAAVIVANGIAVPAVKAASATVPIVFTTGFDPVRAGFVAGLSRPGGNPTGIVFTQTDLAAKQLELYTSSLRKPPSSPCWGTRTNRSSRLNCER